MLNKKPYSWSDWELDSIIGREVRPSNVTSISRADTNEWGDDPFFSELVCVYDGALEINVTGKIEDYTVRVSRSAQCTLPNSIPRAYWKEEFNNLCRNCGSNKHGVSCKFEIGFWR